MCWFYHRFVLSKLFSPQGAKCIDCGKLVNATVGILPGIPRNTSKRNTAVEEDKIK